MLIKMMSFFLQTTDMLLYALYAVRSCIYARKYIVQVEKHISIRELNYDVGKDTAYSVSHGKLLKLINSYSVTHTSIVKNKSTFNKKHLRFYLTILTFFSIFILNFT